MSSLFDSTPSHSAPCASPEEETSISHYGLTWQMVRDILESPSALRTPALKLAVYLLDVPNGRSSVQVASARLKIDIHKIQECVTYNPRLFQLERAATFIRMIASGNDPSIETPQQRDTRLKSEQKSRLLVAKEMAKQAEDEEDTPYNNLWKRIEKIGLDRKGAKGLAKRLISSYPSAIIDHALQQAERSDPANIPGYIISSIQKRLSTTTLAQAPRRIPSKTPRTGRKTVLIGWDHQFINGVRHKLYRMPEGTIQKTPPAPNEHVPTLQDDPGYELI